jgi:hypothetical protein
MQKFFLLQLKIFLVVKGFLNSHFFHFLLKTVGRPINKA